MHDPDNLDRLGAYPVDQDVVRVDDGLASAFRTPWAVEERVAGQSAGAGFDCGCSRSAAGSLRSAM
jgi:hypothetical protein